MITDLLKNLLAKVNQNAKETDENIRALKVQQGKVLLAFIEEYLAMVAKDKNEQYVLDFCDELNKLSCKY